MTELKGKFTDCKIFAETVDQSSISQVYDFLNHPAFEGCKTRFMPDIHAGSGAVIGTTVELSDKVIPNVIGVDIGCGMLSLKLGIEDINLPLLDDFITNNIPSGFSINEKQQFKNNDMKELIEITCEHIGIESDRALKSVGSLGGGNHFIEIGKDQFGGFWLTIHSGSRNFGLQIAKYYQEKAVQQLRKPYLDLSKVDPQCRESVKQKARHNAGAIKKGMEYLTGGLAEEYFQDMRLAQRFASLSRKIMASKITYFLNCSVLDQVESIHNYIDFSDGIIRKGAISAHKGEYVVIPWNMRDGLIIGIGKGNSEWNNSAPHGAGRLMSRGKAKSEINIKDFEESMKDVYSSSVCKSTIDESPMAYKNHEEIKRALTDTVEIALNIKPIYNFKAK